MNRAKQETKRLPSAMSPAAVSPIRPLARLAVAVFLSPLLLAAAPAEAPAEAPGAAPAEAPPAAPAEGGDEAVRVKAAIRALSDAMARGDARAVKAAVLSDGRTDEVLDAMAAVAAANARFNAAVTARFGKEAGFDYAEDLRGWTLAGEELHSAKVAMRGDTAVLSGREGLPPVKKTDAGWKVDLTRLSPGVREAAVQRIPALQWLAWALDETAKEVSADGHAAAATAHKAVETRLRAAVTPVKLDAAGAGAEEGDEARAARATALAMTRALLLGEGELVKELYAGEKDLAPALEVFTRLRAASKKLHAALGQRFPSLVQGSRPDQVDIGPDLLEAIDAARVTVDGRTAIVKPAGDWDAMMLRRAGPRWQVVLAPRLERFLPPARATAAALHEAAAEVEAGKYKTAREFRAALAQKVQAAVAAAAAEGRGPASRPASPSRAR